MHKQKSNFKTRIVLFILFFLFFFTPRTLSEADISIEDLQELEELKQGQSVIREDEKFLEIQTSVKREVGEVPCDDCIYGYDLFVDTPTTFALSSNTPLPQDYILGPGDKLAVEYFGNNNEKKEAFITRSGRFNLPLLGPINLSGMLFSKAEELIANKVKSELIGTEVFLSLSQLRSISGYVVGAAYKPGTYTVNSLSTLTNVIFSTGGPDRSGSLRNIQLKRNGKLIKGYDFYKLLLNGDTSEDIRLLEGDTIFYPLIESSVRVDGAVRRPGLFETKEDETLADILNFSGVKEKKNFKIQFSRFDENNNTREVKINIITDDIKIMNYGTGTVCGGDLMNFDGIVHRTFDGGVAPLNADLNVNKLGKIGNFKKEELYSANAFEDKVYMGITSDYMSPDTVFVHDETGELINTFTVGAAPGDFAIWKE